MSKLPTTSSGEIPNDRFGRTFADLDAWLKRRGTSLREYCSDLLKPAIASQGQELALDLESALKTERQARRALQEAQETIRNLLLKARRQEITYWTLATRLIPSTGDPKSTYKIRKRAAAALRARVSEARKQQQQRARAQTT